MKRCSSWIGKKILSEWNDVPLGKKRRSEWKVDHLEKERRASRNGKMIISEKKKDPL
jgi:hypothetical protein